MVPSQTAVAIASLRLAYSSIRSSIAAFADHARAPDWKIVNYQFYEHLRSQKNELYGYNEWVPGVSLYDTPTELHHDYDFFLFQNSIKNHDIAGVSFRAQWGKTFSDFSIEPFAAYDLKQNPNTFNIADIGLGSPPSIGAGGAFGGYQIKGHPGYSAGINDGAPFFTAGGRTTGLCRRTNQSAHGGPRWIPRHGSGLRSSGLKLVSIWQSDFEANPRLLVLCYL
jgi:hypothetical protein